MTPTLLAEIGRLLHGSMWQRALAADLAVNERTVRRWAAGDSAIPDGVLVELIGRLERHGLDIWAALDRLKPPPA